MYNSRLFCLLVPLCLALIFGVDLFAQAPKFLALQQHKLLYADTVYNESIRKKDTLLRAEAYYLYGKTYEAAGDHETSMDFYFKSLRLLEPRGDSPSLSRLYLKLAEMECRLGDYPSTLRLLRLSIQIAERTNSVVGMLRGYGLMISVHSIDWSDNGKKPDRPRADLDSVRYYLDRRMAIAMESGDTLQIAHAMYGNATIYRTLFNEFEKSQADLHRALELFTEKKREGDRMSVVIALAGHHIDTREYTKALRFLNTAQQIYDRNPFNDLHKQSWIQTGFVECYRATGQWKKAFIHSQRLRELQIGSDLTGAYSKVARQYEAERNQELLKAKETELALRQDALRAHRIFTGTAFILLFWLAVLSYVFYRLYRKNRQISLHNALLIREQSHRVTNGFQAVSSFIRLSSGSLSDAAAKELIEGTLLRIEAMAVLNRKLYKGNKLTEVFMPDFISAIVGNVVNTFNCVHVAIDANIENVHLSSDQAISVGLIVNELVTNSCKYAFPEHPFPGLKVSLTAEPGAGPIRELTLCVADNGFEDPQITSDRRGQTGFGGKLIGMLAEELSARCSFELRNGACFKMTFRQVEPKAMFEESGSRKGAIQ